MPDHRGKKKRSWLPLLIAVIPPLLPVLRRAWARRQAAVAAVREAMAKARAQQDAAAKRAAKTKTKDSGTKGT